jgi:hypothetical protein
MWAGLDSFGSGQATVVRDSERNNELPGSKEARNFLSGRATVSVSRTVLC